MLHDFQKIVQQNGLAVHLSFYADDLALWADYQSAKTGLLPGWLRKYQGQICSAEAYMKNNGFQFSAEKMALVVFSHSQPIRQKVSIKLGAVSITLSKKTKFLGVVLDQKLTWAQHVHLLRIKALCGLGLIKLLTGQLGSPPRFWSVSLTPSPLQAHVWLQSHHHCVPFTLAHTRTGRAGSPESCPRT